MSLQDVLIDEMRDLYSAENQLVKAMSKVAKQVSDERLKAALQEHHEQTKEQVLQLREAFGHLGKKPTGKHCNGMEGCIKEVQEALEEDEEGALKDAGLMGALLRTEHYEIAGYTAALAIAKTLKESEIVGILNEILKQEQTAAKNVLSSGAAVLKAANAQKEDDEDEDEDEEPKDPKEQQSEQESEQDEQDAAPEVDAKSASRKKPAPAKKSKARK